MSLAPTTIWLTDRSRFKIGISNCPRRRYLGYHFGPSGYGLASASESLPLATGQYVHQGIELFMACLAKGALPTLDEVRETIAWAQQQYEAVVTARGFRGMLAGPTTDETIQEQSTLIAGLLWAVRLKFLPWFHEQFAVVEYEQERLHLLDCTCGAAPLDTAEHVRRGCEGHAIMIRTDVLSRRRNGSGLAYFEVKTTGWESSAWAEQWETDYQLALGTLDLPERYGAEVTELFIVGLNKGARKRDWKDEEGRKKQQSPLCYGYCRPGNPPLATDDWLPSHEWIDQDGTTKRASRAHRRRGVWELSESDWPVWTHYRGQDPSMTATECWVRMLPTSVLDKVCFVLGPLNRQDEQLKSVRRAMLAEEQRWQERLWALHEVQQTRPWHDDLVQQTLDQVVPQSWQCRPFGREHQCEFVPICHRHSGWQDPLSTGRYKLRRPHHQPELDQAIARGLLVEESVAVEERE